MSRGHVGDGQEQHFVEMRPAFVPVVGIALHRHPDARVEAVQNVAARSDSIGPIELAVFGVQGFAIVKFDPLAQLEDPGLGVVGGLETLRQFGNDLAVRGHFGEVVQNPAEHADLRVIGDVGGRVQDVGCRRTGQAKANGAALLGLSGDRLIKSRLPKALRIDPSEAFQTHAFLRRPWFLVLAVAQSRSALQAQFIAGFLR